MDLGPILEMTQGNLHLENEMNDLRGEWSFANNQEWKTQRGWKYLRRMQ